MFREVLICLFDHEPNDCVVGSIDIDSYFADPLRVERRGNSADRDAQCTSVVQLKRDASLDSAFDEPCVRLPDACESFGSLFAKFIIRRAIAFGHHMRSSNSSTKSAGHAVRTSKSAIVVSRTTTCRYRASRRGITPRR